MKTPTGNSETANSAPPKKRVGPITFFKEVRQEARKVTWTTRAETIMASILVVVMVVVASVFFFTTDLILSNLIPFITGIAK